MHGPYAHLAFKHSCRNPYPEAVTPTLGLVRNSNMQKTPPISEQQRLPAIKIAAQLPQPGDTAQAHRRGPAPDDEAQVALAHVDGVGDGQVVGDPALPELLVALLRGQAVVEGGQPGGLEGGAGRDAVAQDEAGRRREAAQAVPCGVAASHMPQLNYYLSCRWQAEICSSSMQHCTC